MKKIIILIISIILLTGCGTKTAKDKVNMFLNEYKTLSTNVISELERKIEEEDWTDDQKDKYRKIMRKQYKDIEYEVVGERYENELAYVDTIITVYDLYSAQQNADYYETVTDLSYLDYKLDAMYSTTDRVEYQITFKLEKDTDNNYQIIDLQDSDIEKIHGVYHQ